MRLAVGESVHLFNHGNPLGVDHTEDLVRLPPRTQE
jgi:hypothetical protein